MWLKFDVIWQKHRQRVLPDWTLLYDRRYMVYSLWWWVTNSPICFTNFFSQFFSMLFFQFLLLQNIFFQFASWKRNHNKYSLKKFVDSEFVIGEPTWWSHFLSKMKCCQLFYSQFYNNFRIQNSWKTSKIQTNLTTDCGNPRIFLKYPRYFGQLGRSAD